MTFRPVLSSLTSAFAEGFGGHVTVVVTVTGITSMPVKSCG